MNLHPGVIPVLKRMSADELAIAEMIRDGELTSPQPYHNMMLFLIRITGTGVSYRPALNEYVYRKPEHYLTERFLQRCSGLPVIWQHPDKTMLTSDEFNDRVVGTTFLPFIRDDEVWAIAKIFDAGTIKLLDTKQMSTSPAVLLEKGSINKKLPDGTKLLIEEKPSLLDHIAICENGVWDKGEGPTGIEANVRGDSAMADEKETEDKKDATSDVNDELKNVLDAAMKKLDACVAKMDAWDNEKKDAAAKKDEDFKEWAKEEEKEPEHKKDAEDEDTAAMRMAADKKKDKAKKDSEVEDEKEKEMEKSDAARADAVKELSAQLAEQRKVIEELNKLVRQPIADSDRAGLSEVQSRADSALVALGEGQAPQPLVGESVPAYRRRMAARLQANSADWAKARLDSLSDDVFDIAERKIYADSAAAALKPTNIKPGFMREITKRTSLGHIETTFAGADDTHFVKQFTRPSRRVRNIAYSRP